MTRDRLVFVVKGPPVPWERVAMNPRNVKGGRPVMFMPHATRDYQELVRIAAMGARQASRWMHHLDVERSFSLNMRIFVGDLRGGHGGGGDWDNIAKNVSDALNKVVYPDDGRVVKAEPEKYLDRERPRVEVCVVCRSLSFLDHMNQKDLPSFDAWAENCK